MNNLLLCLLSSALLACNGGVSGTTTGAGGATMSTTATTSSATSSSTAAATTSTSSSTGGGSSSSAGGGGGAGGSGQGGAAPCTSTPTFDDVMGTPLHYCGGPTCHSTMAINGPANDLLIDPADPSTTYQQLLLASTTPGAGQRVVPGDPKASFLYRKLDGDLKMNEGSLMPPKSGGLPMDQLETVRCWILQGAKQN